MSISLAFRGAFHYHAFNKLTIISLLFHQLNPSICRYSFQESLQSIKDTASGKQRPAQGTRYVYVPVLLTTIAFGLSVLALASCQFVLYDDPEEACDVNPLHSHVWYLLLRFLSSRKGSKFLYWNDSKVCSSHWHRHCHFRRHCDSTPFQGNQETTWQMHV